MGGAIILSILLDRFPLRMVQTGLNGISMQISVISFLANRTGSMDVVFSAVIAFIKSSK
jgi:hypothetical protein